MDAIIDQAQAYITAAGFDLDHPAVLELQGMRKLRNWLDASIDIPPDSEPYQIIFASKTYLGVPVPGTGFTVYWPWTLGSRAFQLIRLALTQKHKRKWFLHIRVRKGRHSRHRGPRSDFDYRRVPVR